MVKRKVNLNERLLKKGWKRSNDIKHQNPLQKENTKLEITENPIDFNKVNIL